ncbi:MAG: C40 family peptidase [Bacteroidales bacterium]|nr:C40 family peptidase [Bacteroidales bacterium]MBN2698459.1 C40 family peptidase [Bacteroidales bacterium]
MDKGIILSGFTPVRREPSEKSEMTSQVLFGETFDILESGKEWSLIKSDFDGFEGYISSQGIYRLFDTLYTAAGKQIACNQVTPVIRLKTNQQILLPAGSVAPIIRDSRFEINGEFFGVNNHQDFLLPDSRVSIEKIAGLLISVPYLWGGRCGFGFDCSGLSQFLSRVRGFHLPRDSYQQALTGENVNFIHEALPGDLAFFDNMEGEINHVGIFLEQGRLIHASGYVRIDRIDQQGIFNMEKGKYSHHLRVIKRPKNTSSSPGEPQGIID